MDAMLAIALLALQVSGPPGDEQPPAARGASDCARDTEEIVVCASDPDAYRLRQVETTQRSAIPRASGRIAPGVTASADAQPGGGNTVVPRIMAGVRIAF